MGLVRTILSSDLRRWIRRNSMMLAANLTSSMGLVYLWNRGHKYLVPAVSCACLGSTCFYFSARSRGKVSSNQAIVVTGCDSGLGYSLALHCRQLGATVIAGVLQEDGEGARKLKKNDIFVYPLDVTQKNSVADFKNSVHVLLRENNLILHSLINNAGILIFGEFEWQTEEQLLSQIEVNVVGSMRITRELLPLMRRHSSRIIVISSHCTIEPLPGVAVYGATKAAIKAWATAIRVELKKYGIQVVAFVPGTFAHQSNILSRQPEHFETMRGSMSKEAMGFYGDYFRRYAEFFNHLARPVKPNKITNEGIYEAFEGALLDKYPSAVYKCEPWRYFFYHSLFGILPTCLRDRLVGRFVGMPVWTQSDICLSSSNTSASESPARNIGARSGRPES